VIGERDLERMKRDGFTVADVEKIARVLSGREPFIIDHKRRSPCCDAPLGVYQGGIQNMDGTPYSGGHDWKIPIVRRCENCGETVTLSPEGP
jgi:hypothetical protein